MRIVKPKKNLNNAVCLKVMLLSLSYDYTKITTLK